MLMTTASTAYSVSQNIDTHQWQHRLLLITSETKDDLEVSSAIDQFIEDPDGLTDRRIIIYQITPDSFKRFDESTWHRSDEVFGSYVRERHDERIILIGLDGGVKERYPINVRPEDIWADIDKMPMRRSELRSSKPD